MDGEWASLGVAGMAVFGFMGSLHCAAMCGGLAASACPASRPMTKAALQYHVTRIAAYAVLGFVAGLATGMAVAHWLSERGKILALGLGGAMVLYALRELWRVWRGLGATPPSSSFALGLTRRIQSLPFPKPVLLGMTTALLPCGFLMAALVQAALVAHPVYSALGMALFAVASAPALAAGSGLLRIASQRWPRSTPSLLALVLLATGVSVFLRAWHHHHH